MSDEFLLDVDVCEMLVHLVKKLIESLVRFSVIA